MGKRIILAVKIRVYNVAAIGLGARPGGFLFLVQFILLSQIIDFLQRLFPKVLISSLHTTMNLLRVSGQSQVPGHFPQCSRYFLFFPAGSLSMTYRRTCSVDFGTPVCHKRIAIRQKFLSARKEERGAQWAFHSPASMNLTLGRFVHGTYGRLCPT